MAQWLARTPADWKNYSCSEEPRRLQGQMNRVPLNIQAEAQWLVGILTCRITSKASLFYP